MRSLTIIRISLAALLAMMLTGCLISEAPVLDARTGKAKPIRAGDYESCEKGGNGGGDDCQPLIVAVDATGEYSLTDPDEDEPALMRLRRVARNAYAVQISAGEDEGYMYYYGAKDGDGLALWMMMCDSLPASLRERLIAEGGFTVEDDDASSCIVNTVKALSASAKAYHNGEAEELAEEDQVLIRPASKRAE